MIDRAGISQPGDAAARAACLSGILDKWSDLAGITGRWSVSDDRPVSPSARQSAVPVLDATRFACCRARRSRAAFSYHAYCYLLDMDFHLASIETARAAGDFVRLARHARLMADMAANLGAMRTSAAASRLEEAGNAMDDAGAGRLIDELGLCCADAEAQLRGFLDQQAFLSGAA